VRLGLRYTVPADIRYARSVGDFVVLKSYGGDQGYGSVARSPKLGRSTLVSTRMGDRPSMITIIAMTAVSRQALSHRQYYARPMELFTGWPGQFTGRFGLVSSHAGVVRVRNNKFL